MASITKRIHRNGGVSWGVRVRVNGYGTQTKTFVTKLEAQPRVLQALMLPVCSG